jgi:dienelactone hydrolase
MSKLFCLNRLLMSVSLSLTFVNAHALDTSRWTAFNPEEIPVNVVMPDADSPEKITIKALLLKPSIPAPWNTVVISASCAGEGDLTWNFYPKEYLANGIAVVLVEPYTPRGYDSICGNQFRLTVGQRLQDLHQVLDKLRTDQRFTPNKIALSGHSVGGTNVFMSAYAEAQEKLKRNTGSFNAFVASAPECIATFRKTKLVGPMLVLMGEKDDWTRPAPCLEEIKRLESNGETVSQVMLPNASHTFSTTGTVFSSRVMKTPDEFPQVYFSIIGNRPNVTKVQTIDGTDHDLREIVGKYAGFMGNKLFGATVGGNGDKLPEATTKAAEFLKKNGW